MQSARPVAPRAPASPRVLQPSKILQARNHTIYATPPAHVDHLHHHHTAHHSQQAPMELFAPATFPAAPFALAKPHPSLFVPHKPTTTAQAVREDANHGYTWLNHPTPYNPFRSRADEDAWYVPPNPAQRQLAMEMNLPLYGIL